MDEKVINLLKQYASVKENEKLWQRDDTSEDSGQSAD
jgi:hypothetical protein